MKKCSYCYTEIDDRANICPSCRKRVGNANKYGIARKPITLGKACGVLIMIFVLMIITATIIGNMRNTSSPSKTYTKEQKDAAQKYQDILMKSGLVKEFKPEGKLQIVYVDRKMWNAGTYENKKEILKGLSQSNEIQGYTPWIEIKDYHSGETYAAIKPPLTFEVYK